MGSGHFSQSGRFDRLKGWRWTTPLCSSAAGTCHASHGRLRDL
jgi:hypothetical protein